MVTKDFRVAVAITGHHMVPPLRHAHNTPLKAADDDTMTKIQHVPNLPPTAAQHGGAL